MSDEATVETMCKFSQLLGQRKADEILFRGQQRDWLLPKIARV